MAFEAPVIMATTSNNNKHTILVKLISYVDLT